MHVLIHLLLHRGHLALEYLLDLIGKLALHLALQAAQKEGPKHLMQTVDDEQALLFVHLHLLARGSERRAEPLLKVHDGVEDRGQKEVEQRPQLRQAVLQRRARKE